MAQFKTGTVTVTNGSDAVTGVGMLWLANISVGDWFIRKGDDVSYQVKAVLTDTSLTLATNYAGVTASGVTYSVTTDFTANFNIPLLARGDIDTATVFARAMSEIDIAIGQNTGEWIDFNQTPTFVDADTFTFVGDQTDEHHVDRRIRIQDSVELYGTITSSVFTTLTTIDVRLDTGSITSAISAVAVGIASADGRQSISGSGIKSGIPEVNTINEDTAGAGVTVDGVLLKDGGATLTGVLDLPNGSAAAPSLAHTGDLNTGIFFGTDIIGFATAGSEVGQFDPNGTLFIGDTSNANMTGAGITIAGAAGNNSQHFTLKNADIATGLTTIISDPDVETDDFFYISKRANTAGGAHLKSFAESTGTSAPFSFDSYGGAADTTDTTSSFGLITMYVSQHDGANALADVATGGNAYVWRVRDGGADVTRLLMKDDGTLHATNVTAGAGDLDGVSLADAYDDVGLVRLHQRTIHNDIGVAISKWDEAVKVNEDDLKRLGVLSSQGHFTCLQRMDSLLGGAIWQVHTRVSDIEEREQIIAEVLDEEMPGFLAKVNEALEAANPRPMMLPN